MPLKSLDSSKKSLVIGAIYDKLDWLPLDSLCQKYEFVIINGNITYPLENYSNRIDKLIKMQQKYYNLFYCNGDKDLLFKINQKDLQTIKWIDANYNALKITFTNASNCLIMCGGVKPGFNKSNLIDTEISFISNINNEPWHLIYGGGMSYIITNNPLTLNEPKYYKYSCQIGNNYETNIVYAQEIDGLGVHNTLKFTNK